MSGPAVPRYAPIETPLGPGYFAYTPKGVLLLQPAASERAFLRAARRALGVDPVRRDPAPAFLNKVRRGIVRGDGASVDLSALGAFQRAVLEACAEIPPGQVRAYAWIAQRIGRPKAVRAVGSALARNPVPLMVPCHRVVRSDGALGHYGIGGTSRKRFLLRLEGALTPVASAPVA